MVGRTSIMAIKGGTFAKLGGGKFANGAMSVAFTHLFNGESASSLTRKFFSGESGEYVFGPESEMTQDLRNDPRLRSHIALWQNKYFLSHGYWPKVGESGFIDTGLFFPIEQGGANMTLQFVGSYTTSFYITGSNEVTIVIYNSTSWKSALYHLIPDSISNNMNSIKQYYWWKEPLR